MSAKIDKLHALKRKLMLNYLKTEFEILNGVIFNLSVVLNNKNITNSGTLTHV